MLTQRFARLFRKLVTAFERHQDVRRSPDNVPEIADARWELEHARAEIVQERQKLHSAAAGVDRPPRKADISPEGLVDLRMGGLGGDGAGGAYFSVRRRARRRGE